jgi:hypothetical protein
VPRRPLDTDSLFQLALADFTGARNALAAQLKKRGHGDEAARVKGLAKPSISAWTANQLYWKHRAVFDRLMKSGLEFRHAQEAQLAGRPADLRGALDARRMALAELAGLGAKVLTDAGHTPTPETMRRVTTTLEALSTYGDAPGGPPAGRLVDDVDPPGFETLAALIPSPGSPRQSSGERTAVIPFRPKARRAGKAAAKDPRALEEERRARRDAAKDALQAAERRLRDARVAGERAEAALKKAAARVKSAEQIRAEAEIRLDKATADLVEAKQEARTIAARAEEAAQAVTDAEAAVARASRELDDARE